MNISEITSQVQAISPSVTIAQVEDFLDKAKITVELVDGGVIAEMARKLKGGAMSSPQGNVSQSQSIAPIAPKKTPLPEVPKAARSADEVKSRREVATVDALSNPTDTVSEILEQATAKANDRLAKSKTALVDKLAAQIEAKTLEEIQSTMDFFDRFMNTGTRQALKPFEEAIEAEIVS